MKMIIDTLKEMDGWMTCDFTSFSTVFQLYQDDGRSIMKAVCTGTPFAVEKISPRVGLQPGTFRSCSRPELNPLSYRGSVKRDYKPCASV